MVGAEPARVRAGWCAQRPLDGSRARRAAHRSRPQGEPGGARVGAPRAAAGNRRAARGRAQARGLHQRRDRGDAVRRAAVDGHREPDHQARHARQGSAVRRVPVRAHHAHWVWLHDAAGGMLWSGPDTPLFTLNDIFRGQWRRKMEPDGTLFAYVLHNYWPTNFAPSQGRELSFRYRLSALPRGGERAETVRRGWAACDPLYVSTPYASVGSGARPRKDSGLFIADPGVAVVGVKPADDRAGAVVKLVDLTGVARAVAVWPGAYGFRGARRTNFVEMNGDRVPVAPDGHVTIDLPAWGAAALRLFTPREGAD